MRKFNLAIVGATGKVGQTMRNTLKKRDFPVDRIRYLASARSAGKNLDWEGKNVEVEIAAEADFSGVDYAIFSAGASISRELCPKAASAGALVIDNSSAWRMDDEVPLVVSEVNPHALSNIPKNIVANPNCTTMVGMVALKPLHAAAGLKSMVVSTYQAVSGAGQSGITELEAQLGRNEESREPKNFEEEIALNVVPKCGSYTESQPDETIEELKLRQETRKILEIPDLKVSALCVRVGVVIGHSLSINAEFEDELTPEQARQILKSAPGIELSDLPTPLKAAGQDLVSVGRIKKDPTVKNGLALFVAGDNLLKGAALNAIQITELLTHQM